MQQKLRVLIPRILRSCSTKSAVIHSYKCKNLHCDALFRFCRFLHVPLQLYFFTNVFWNCNNKSFQDFKLGLIIYDLLFNMHFLLQRNRLFCRTGYLVWNLDNEKIWKLWTPLTINLRHCAFFVFHRSRGPTGPDHSIRGELLSLAVDCRISRLRHPVAGVLSLSSVPDFPHFPRVPFHGLSHRQFSLTARVGVRALERHCAAGYVWRRRHVLTFASGFLRS